MRYTRQGDTYVLRFEEGEILPDRLLEFLSAESIAAGSLTGIGALKRSRIAFFDIEAREYRDIDLDEQMEVLALAGNVALHEGKPLVHAHVTLGRRDGSTLGGHLRWGIVRPTLEVFLRTLPQPLQRALDPNCGLPLLDLNDSDAA
jgi:predicted DNA-binding protein with PD1-like motif